MPALRATPASTTSADGGADQTLPDPSVWARLLAAAMLAMAVGLALIMNDNHWTDKAYTPPKGSLSFSLLAGYYVGAQIIERLMELGVPWLPAWPPSGSVGNVRAAYVKADRAKLTLGVASVLGVAAAAGFGLFFLQVVGIHASHTIDSLVTGVLIAAGTKPLHDFISLLQNQTSPTTGTKAS